MCVKEGEDICVRDIGVWERGRKGVCDRWGYMCESDIFLEVECIIYGL